MLVCRTSPSPPEGTVPKMVFLSMDCWTTPGAAALHSDSQLAPYE